MRRLSVLCIALILGTAQWRSARAEPAPHFPLQLTEDHHHLVDRNHRPFLVKVFSAWGLIQALSEADAIDFMDSVKARGFNTLLVSAISWDRRFAGDPPRWQGISPFTSEWDFSTPNPEYFAHVDRVLELARERGLLVMLVPCYLGYYSDPTQGWASRLLDPHNDPQKSLAYGRYLGLRYRDQANILWVAGGDNDGKDAVYSHMRNVITGIKQSADQLWTGHFDTETRFSTNNPLYADVMDIDSLYLWVEARGGAEPQHASELARSDRGRMLLQLDQSYEHDVPHDPDNENEQWIRRKNYAGLLSGCAGTSFCPGARGNPLYTFKHWRTLMDTVGMRQARHLFALFESRSWQTLRPDRDHSLIVAGQGELTSIDYVSSAISEHGNTLIAYVPSQRSISVDMSSLSGFLANAWWYDPRTGIAHFAGVHRTRGVHEFDSPAGDWVLVLDDTSLHFGPPGELLQWPPRPVPLAPRPETIGETAVFEIDDSGNANMIITQAATIERAARLQDLSFYVNEPAGHLRLGLYDSSGPNQLPGRLLGSTSELTPVTGWNRAQVTTPAWLPAGTYWLAYLTDDNNLHFRRAGQDSGTSFAAPYSYAALPLEYPANPQNLTDQWSFFGSLH